MVPRLRLACVKIAMLVINLLIAVSHFLETAVLLQDIISPLFNSQGAQQTKS